MNVMKRAISFHLHNVLTTRELPLAMQQGRMRLQQNVRLELKSWDASPPENPLWSFLRKIEGHTQAALCHSAGASKAGDASLVHRSGPSRRTPRCKEKFKVKISSRMIDNLFHRQCLNRVNSSPSSHPSAALHLQRTECRQRWTSPRRYRRRERQTGRP